MAAEPISGPDNKNLHLHVTETFGVAFFHGINLLLTFGVGVLLARWLGAANYGIYALVLATIAIISMPVAVGAPVALVRFISEYQERSAWREMRGIIHFSNLAIGGLATLAAVILAVITLSFHADSGELVINTFLIGSILIPITALSRLRQCTLQGLHRPLHSQFPEFIVKPALFLIIASISWWFLGGVAGTPSYAMMLWVCSVSVAFFIGSHLQNRAIPLSAQAATPRYEVNLWIKTSWPMALSGCFNVVYMYSDIILLGILSTHENVGIYHIVSRVANLILLMQIAAGTVFAPTFSKLRISGQTEELQHVASRSVQIAFLGAAVTFIFLIATGYPLLGYVFGTEFRKGYLALLILAAAKLGNAACGPASTMLNMLGHERVVVSSLGFSMCLNAGFGVILIPILHIEGAAIATAISMITNNVILALSARRLVGVRCTIIGSMW